MLRFQNPKPMGLFDLTALSLSASMMVALSAVASEKPELPPRAMRSTESTPETQTQAQGQPAASTDSQSASTQVPVQAPAAARESEHQRAPAAARPSMSKESEDALRGAVSRVNEMMDSAAQSAEGAAEPAQAGTTD